MAWNQVKAFDKIKAGKVAGQCLANVRKGYGINSKYPDATTAWGHTQQHRDRNVPGGIAVPLFYTFYVNGVNEGHINVRMPDGTVWSDGNTYASIVDYENKKAPGFIGWGESVDDIRVISYTADPVMDMPAVGSRIQLIPIDTRTTYREGTATVIGAIHVTDDTFIYVVRGYDKNYPGRILINSTSGGGNNVGMALYYLNGGRIPGWKKV